MDHILPLLELPAPCLRSVLLALWPDPKDLAAVSCCCKATAELCADQQIWLEVVLRRYGPSALPGQAPEAGGFKPLQLDGWVFYPGLSAAADGDKAAEGGWETPQQLAEQCSNKGFEAFTTDGKMINNLQHHSSWKRTSYTPYEGTYVQSSIAAAIEPKPEQGQDERAGESPWPPVAPGWVYFPSCDSPGFTRTEAQHNLTRHRDLQSLLAAARNDPLVKAVTTAGETKMKLGPQWCWHTAPSYDAGLYVRQEEVDRLELTVPPQVPDYRLLARKLSCLKVCGAEMWACWLNDEYLTLQDVGADVGCNGTALKLNNVWWLDISGVITGVAPGTYEVIWKMDLPQRSSQYPETSFTLSATAESLHLDRMPDSSSSSTAAQLTTAGASGVSAELAAPPAPSSSTNSSRAVVGTGIVGRMAALFQGIVGAVEAVNGSAAPLSGSAGAAGSSSSSGANRAAIGATGTVSVTMNEQQMRSKLRPTSHWGTLSVGYIKLEEISKVKLHFFSHDDWKSSISWAYAELRPVLTPMQQQHEQRRKQHWQQWWESSKRAVKGCAHDEQG